MPGQGKDTIARNRKKLPVIPRRPVEVPKGERGAVIILFTFIATLVMIPMVGLGIDGSILFWTKAKLSAAVDAAALAAARSLSVGTTLAAQESSATATAQQYFAADFPPGFLGIPASSDQLNVTFVETGLKSRIVTVQGSTSAPLYFMRIFGFQSQQIVANGQATRRDLNLILVLDRSGSMGPSPGANVCSTLIAPRSNLSTTLLMGVINLRSSRFLVLPTWTTVHP